MSKRYYYLILLIFSVFATACDENTATVGYSVLPDADALSTSMGVFPIVSRTIESGPVLANTSECYLGSVVDPETHATTTCSFLAQYHLREGMTFPQEAYMMKNTSGEIVADSCFLVLYFSNYYGDSLTTMKVQVQELDPAHVLEENINYYTSLDPSDYLSNNPSIDITQTYTVRDLTKNVSTTSDAYSTVSIKLPVEYAHKILRAYYTNPEYFRNSYTFIRSLCPGFYFKSIGGVGSMLNVRMSSLDIYFRYHMLNANGNDSVYSGFQRMAATEEVIQTTVSDNRIPDAMLDANNAYTYVKSPAALLTELTLPVSDIVGGTHYADSLNQVRISIGRYHDSTDSQYTLDPPSSILMLPLAEVQQFFAEKRLGDGVTSFITEYSSENNRYTFDNIAPYVSYLRRVRDAGAGVTGEDTEAQRLAKYAVWEAANPDWNKVALVPVSADYSETTNGYTNTTTKTLLRVRNELGLYSARLQGGPNGSDLYTEVIYSRFAQ
ncbi:MAG: DUF4270 domain-containing protein [Alloprevotella sp.]|nr:DUF4270 domain-containing protein [Alloprevotella sp.]